ncbi:ATP-binding protein [Candidatus Woesearchaeota archaeon]|nr:ATP-binding protein [Candidatus Woesearchaeota archaeon]MCF8013074.1 ATP-binding protein [Candidatus Woesearchaeota archaeon]
MDAKDQIQKFTEFFEINYHDKLLSLASKGEEYIALPFKELAKFDIELADLLLEQPEDVIKAAEYAISKFDLGVEEAKLNVRFFDLPKSSLLQVRDIRSRNLNKMYEFKGLVRQKSDVRPQVTSARFECPSCGNIIPMLQMDDKFKEPNNCNVCARKGKFNLLSKELVDAQKIVLEEDPEDMDGGEQPKRINIFLKNDLVSPMSDKKTNPGAKIIVTGVIKEVPITLHSGGKSTRYELMLEVNHIEPMQEEFETLVISKEKEKEILELSKDPKIYEKLVTSMAPSIYGHDRIKEALILQMFGGRLKEQDDGVKRRGDIHVLLIGDPGSGKCVSGDTKISLENGEIKKIKEIADNRDYQNEFSESNIKLPSLQLDGAIRTGFASKVWKRKINENLLSITLRSGKKLIVTKNHPLFTNHEGFIIAKEAKTYVKGDYLATPNKLNILGETQFLENFKEKNFSNNKKTNKFPNLLDKCLARFLGYLCANGCFRNTNTSSQISFSNADDESLKDYQYLINGLFDSNTKTRSKKGTNAKEIYLFSKNIFNFLNKEFFEIVTKSINKNIPNKVLKSPNIILSEFIKSLFECDSHVNNKKRQIEFHSTSKELVENLQIALLRFGIVAFKKEKIKFATNTINKSSVKSYELIISGEFLKLYSKQIGFVSKRKIDALKFVIDTNNSADVDVVPNISKLLFDVRKSLGLSQSNMGVRRSTYCHYEQNNRMPSKRTMKKIVSHLYKNGFYSYSTKLLAQIAYSDIFWDKILDVQEVDLKETFVYDFEVNSTHNFVANGVIIHNSQLLKRVSIVAPKTRFVSGKGASGAGLTAAVVRDEFTKGWALEAGALVLANKGMVCIDELDKMSSEDTSAMHEALEQQSISISKANIQATLRSETTVLAAANPKFGRFDPYEILVKQIDLPPPLINRFDLIFPVKDLPNREKDEKLASFILKLHKDETAQDTPLDSETIKLYVAYAKQRIHPLITEPAINEIKDYFVNMRNSGGSGEDGKIQSVPISARQLEGLVRLSEASAKTRLSNKVTKADARRAIDLLHHCLTLIGLDTETGKFDIDRIATGISASQRGNVHIVKEIIVELEKALNKDVVPVNDIVREAEIKGLSEEKTDEILENLKRKGDIFNPKPGTVKRM